MLFNLDFISFRFYFIVNLSFQFSFRFHLISFIHSFIDFLALVV